MSQPPPEPPDVSKTGGNPATGEEPDPSTAYGYDDRVVTLMPRHYFIEHIALKDLPVQGSDSDSDSSAPVRPTRVDLVFTEATLIIVPTLRKAVVDNADDCGDGNKPRNTLYWDIVLWDPSHKTAVLKRLPDQISYELLDRDAAAEYIYGGIVRGRFTKERHRDRVRAALQKLAGPLTEDVENPLAWANDIVKGLARTLRGRMELSLRDRAIDNDNLRLIDLMDIVARDHTVKHYLEYQDYTVVDRILLEKRLKWSGTAYPPCALSLVHSSAGIEHDIVLPPGDNWKVQSLAPLPPDKTDSAIVLIPYKLSHPLDKDSPIAWKIVIVALDTWSCRAAFVTEVFDKRGRSYGVDGVQYAAQDRHERKDSAKVADERGGILLGYCREETVDAAWKLIRHDSKLDVDKDTLFWAKVTLIKAAKEHLILAPDRSSTLQAEWIEMLFDYLDISLSREAVVRVVNVVDGSKEWVSSLDHMIQGHDICDEHFLALKRQTRRVLHPSQENEQKGQRYGDTSVLPMTGGRGGPSSNSAAPYHARWLPDNYPGAPQGSVTSSAGMIRPQTNQYRYSDARGNNYRG